MPHVAPAPITDINAGSQRQPTATTTTTTTTTARTAASGHEGQGGAQANNLTSNVSSKNLNGNHTGTMEGSPCMTPHHTSSPLRYGTAGGGFAGNPNFNINGNNNNYGNFGVGGRQGCYASHHSAASFYNNSTSINAMGGGGGGGYGGAPSRTTSFPSNELQEYISMTSPTSDFYYYSPQQFYLESPGPCAAAELYGDRSRSPRGVSPHTPNFAASVPLPPPVMGCYGYHGSTSPSANSNVNNNGSGSGEVAGGPHTPSLHSSVSINGSRFPQWYLPRGFYGSSSAAAGVYGGMPSYGGYMMPVYPAPTGAEEDVLSCEEGSAPVRGGQGLPLPPRLSPQMHPNVVGPFALPPSMIYAGGRGAGATAAVSATAPPPSPLPSNSVAPLQKAAASSMQSPSSPSRQARQTRLQPFVPYDGRAYGLPVHGGLSCAEAAVAIARCALASDANTAERSATAAGVSTRYPDSEEANENQQQMQGQPQQSVAAMPLNRATQRGAKSDAPVASKHPGEGEESYLKAEKTLLADAHTRLSQLRSKAQTEVNQGEEAQKVEQQTHQQHKLQSVEFTRAHSAPSSPSATPAPAAAAQGSLFNAVAAGVRKQLRVGVPKSPTDAAAATAPRRPAAAKVEVRTAGGSQTDGMEAELPISPIPRLPASEDADTARLEDSLLTELELSSQPRSPQQQAASAETHALLQQVLSVPGVKWRHDPYSRRVLAKPTRPLTVGPNEEGAEVEAEEEGDAAVEEGAEEVSTPHSEPSSPQPLMPQAGKVNRKRPTPDESGLRESGSSASNSTVPTTQPPGSPATSLHTQGSHCGSNNHHNGEEVEEKSDELRPGKTDETRKDDGPRLRSPDGAKRQPSARRMPIKKVCVRHFLSGSSADPHVSAEHAVGALTAVITPLFPTVAARHIVSSVLKEARAAMKKSAAATAKSAATAVSSFPAAATNAVAETSTVSDAAAPEQQPPTAGSMNPSRSCSNSSNSSNSCVTPPPPPPPPAYPASFKTSGMRGEGTARMPPPRSQQQQQKQQQKQRESGVENAAVKQGTKAASPPSSQQAPNGDQKSASARSRYDEHSSMCSNSSSRDRSSHSGTNEGSRGGSNDAPLKEATRSLVLSDPAVKSVGPFPAKSTAAAAAAGATASTESSTLSWAWRARVSQGALAAAAVAVSDAVAAATVPHSDFIASWAGGAPVASLEELDTSLLSRLYRRLLFSKCFRDVLEAREHRLGAESNSSSGVVGRNVARRYGGRGGEARLKGPARAMITEAEVTHVFVLQHRCRTSCAVASQYFELGAEVVVDGDMGVETGVVKLVLTKSEYYNLTPHEREAAELAKTVEDAVSASIHRVITEEEKEVQTTLQRPLEDTTLSFLRFLATQPSLFYTCRIECMNFVNVEFQADAQKLYVFYQTSGPVRFLELATYLNHVFHCRIWMNVAKGY